MSWALEVVAFLVEVEDPTDDVDCPGVEFLPTPIGGGGPLLCSRERELGKLILGLAEDTLTMGASARNKLLD
jgi:hypothetical protein